MTAFGANPSFCSWTARLATFANLLLRAKQFEVCLETGVPTGEVVPVGENGWPLARAGWVGVRLFGDMGTAERPRAEDLELYNMPASTRCRVGGNGLITVYWAGGDLLGRDPQVRWKGRAVTAFFDGPSMMAIAGFKPAALRTLDWSLVNKRRPGMWAERDRTEDDLQGTDLGMCEHLQARASRLLRAHLWYNVAPRYELTVAGWKARLVERFRELEATCDRPPILELGNEAWNDKISVLNAHLKGLAGSNPGWSWEDALAQEVAWMAEAADEVFGPRVGAVGYQSWYLFLGGFIQDPVSMERIIAKVQALGVKVDLAGPACYVGPQRARRDQWKAQARVPSVSELHDACLERAAEVEGKLAQHVALIRGAGVPYVAVYEAGQSMLANAEVWRPAGLAYQRDALCGDLYRQIRLMLKRQKVDLANWYSAATSQNPGAPVDPFGLLEGTGPDLVELPKATAAKGG